MINITIIEAVDKEIFSLNKELFEESRDRVLTGIKKKINKFTLKQLVQTAVHESGHALTCYLDFICKENLYKISIVPRGTSSSKSYELSNDSMQGTKDDLISIIDKSLGGMFAEEIFFSDQNKMSRGCGRDLQRATDVAKSMFKKYGMGREELGIQVINDSSYVVEHKISSETRDKLDTAILNLINERSQIVKSKLLENSDKLKLLVSNLVEYEELTKADMDQIFRGDVLNHKIKKNSEVLQMYEQANTDSHH